MSLQKLIPAQENTAVQQTTLGLDVIPRFVCNTWEEATADPEGIDVVILGAGMYGSYCASKIYELSKARFGPDEKDKDKQKFKALRVLVLDAGPFLVPEHNQNIPDIGLSTPSVFGASSILSGTTTGTTNLVWGFGWRSNQRYSEQAYCIGGKGIYWGGWCPRLQENNLKDWPEEIADYLLKTNLENPVGKRPIDHTDPFNGKKIYKRGDDLSAYETLEYEIGVSPVDDFVFDPVNIVMENKTTIGLNNALHFFLDTQKNNIDPRITKVLPAPIAVQTQSFISGLFALDKYSSIPGLISSVRNDHGDGRESNLRISVVPFTHIVRLECASSEESPNIGTRLVNRIVVKVNGKTEILQIGSHCQVVLAMSCIESTRLALESFSLESSLLKPPGEELLGRNFMVHLRADISFKVEKKKFEQFVVSQWPDKSFAEIIQLASLHIQCEGKSGTYQYQLYAATNNPDKFGDPDGKMYKMVPDLDIQNQIASDFDADFISFVLRSSGEVKGGRNSPYRDPSFDFIDLAGIADYDSEFEHKRAWVQFKTANGDHTADPIWEEMHDTAHAIARALANGGQLIYNGNYTLPALRNQQASGTSWHDAGTLWMGNDPNLSVTDVNGHFHHITNAYCCDQALFTNVGSANPVLTGLCLSRKVASNIVARHDTYKVPNAELKGFKKISLLRSSGWLTAPYNGIKMINNEIIETQPSNGIGIYYLPEEMGDFELYVEWKAFRNPAFANSGVLLRMPDPKEVDFKDQLQFDEFYNASVEIQIDDSGKNFNAARTPNAIFGDSLYKTGAIYGVTPATQWAGTVWAPDGDETKERYWNVYQIKAAGNLINVRLNGMQISSAQLPNSKKNKGFIGLQFHTGRVQFRNLQIK